MSIVARKEDAMAQEYINNKTRMSLEYLMQVTKDMPTYGRNFIITLIQGSEDGKTTAHALGTARAYAIIVREFLAETISMSESEYNGKGQQEIEKEQLKFLQAITPKLLNRVVQGDKNLTDNAKRHRAQAIKAFYAYLHSQGLISMNPIIGYKPDIGKRAPKKEVRFTEADKEKLLKAITDTTQITGKKDQEIAEKASLRNAIIALLITEEGFTITDITALDVSDYDKKKHTLTKISTEQEIEVGKRVAAMLNEYLESPATSDKKVGTRSSFSPKEDEQALFIGRKRDRLAERSVIYMIRRNIERAFGEQSGFTPKTIRKESTV